jgi:hypothetical protein
MSLLTVSQRLLESLENCQPVSNPLKQKYSPNRRRWTIRLDLGLFSPMVGGDCLLRKHVEMKRFRMESMGKGQFNRSI